MARYLAYTSPARGHLYPIVDTLLELQNRGHEVHVRTLRSEIPVLRELGLHAEGVSAEIEKVALDTWKASSPQEGLAQALKTYASRSTHEVPDIRAAIREVNPDGLIIDVTTAGAAAVAETTGLPWAQTLPLFQWASFPGIDPTKLTLVPFGLDPAGIEIVNSRRREVGLAPAQGSAHFPAPLNLYCTGSPLEPGTPLPESFRMVGPGLWEPVSPVPDWYKVLEDPVVVVSISSEFQGDDALVRATLQALAGEEVRVVVTTAAHDPADFEAPSNTRLIRFLPHGPVLRKAACVVCHGGMGITQKALAAGVPLCVVPFGRDQFDVAERVVTIGAGTSVLPWELSPASVGSAIRQAMKMTEGAKAAAAAIAGAGGPQAAADSLESLFRTSSNADSAVQTSGSLPRTQPRT
ncbi:MAG: glycosyltransferase [Candidatus Dormibacteraeota bacterium]|nr:glycosyltransferase [Candidatus Dormibacteraeota bacterium]